MSSAETAPQPHGGRATEAAALELKGVTAGYGDAVVVRGVDMTVPDGRVVAVVGPNGAGKSTLLKAILGIARLMRGRVELHGRDITGQPLQNLARLGVGYVPQTDDVFEALRVHENLEMGGYLVDRQERARRVETTLDVFPQLRSKMNRYVETLSGGERKMTAIARVLMLNPSILVLDEPTAGLAPELSRNVLRNQVRALGDLGKAVLLVEQKAVAALEVSDWAYMMVRGQVVMSARAAEVLDNPEMRQVFLGAKAPESARDEPPR